MSGRKSTGFRGVVRHQRGGNFFALVRSHGTAYYLGTFPTAENAARAYDAKARELYGERAILNFPDLIELFDRAVQIGSSR
jgi:hypothetical protein